MLHSNKNKQLGRGRNARNALVKSLATSFIRDEKITTTAVKAKVIRSVVERLVTKGRAGTLAARRLIAASVGPVAADKVVKTIAPRYKGRAGGYTRITKVATRLSDGAKMAQIEFV